jgi:hypothetical protein
MMNATRLLLTLFFVSLYGGLTYSSAIQAGVSSMDVSTPEKEVKNSSVREQVYQIRCWQEGRLLFEESDWVLTPEQAKQIMVRAKKQKADTGVLVIELRNSICLLKQVN